MTAWRVCVLRRQAGMLKARQPDVVQQALREANLTMNEIDGVAYTRGPGTFLLQLKCTEC
jgi:tRNA A37 threonylcarbamoyltransferase TsaD